MPNQYYDNDLEALRFQPGTTVSADAVDSKLDEIASGFGAVEVDTNRSLKFPAEPGTSQEFTATPLERRRKVLGFDENGTLALLAGFGWRGDWATATDYFVNDVFRDAVTKNLYVVNVRHTSAVLADDLTAGKAVLAINLAELEQLRDEAQTAAGTATTKADQASASAGNAQTSAGAAITAQGEAEAAQALSEGARDASQLARNASQTAQGLSEDARDASQTAKGLSETAQAASETARDKSQDWSEEAEDVPVETGQYSAKHWAVKAAGVVADGVIDDEATSASFTWSSQEITGQLSAKVDKVTGKALSDNNFTTAYKTELDNLQTELNTKVDKVTGKALSDENLTTANKAKLDNLQPASRGLQLFMGG